MKRIDLEPVEHQVKTGQTPGDLTPNVTEDSIFYLNDSPIGFYLKSVTGKLKQYLEIANHEFMSDRVPKSDMNRASAIRQQSAREDIKAKFAHLKGEEVTQMSTLLGSIPPKPIVRRNYPTISAVHRSKSAQNFIKAMLLTCDESEKVLKDIMPDQYALQEQIFTEVDPRWRFGKLFTSSISNYNISAHYHRDTGNFKNTINVILTKRHNATGGCLVVPDFGAVIEQADNSMLVYPAWLNVHGVTPIRPTYANGYRNTFIFYPLKAFRGIN